MHKRKIHAFHPLLLSPKREKRNKKRKLFQVVFLSGRQSFKYAVKSIQKEK